jgi:hypothetical protein
MPTSFSPPFAPSTAAPASVRRREDCARGDQLGPGLLDLFARPGARDRGSGDVRRLSMTAKSPSRFPTTTRASFSPSATFIRRHPATIRSPRANSGGFEVTRWRNRSKGFQQRDLPNRYHCIVASQNQQADGHRSRAWNRRLDHRRSHLRPVRFVPVPLCNSPCMNRQQRDEHSIPAPIHPLGASGYVRRKCSGSF